MRPAAVPAPLAGAHQQRRAPAGPVRLQPHRPRAGHGLPSVFGVGERRHLDFGAVPAVDRGTPQSGEETVRGVVVLGKERSQARRYRHVRHSHRRRVGGAIRIRYP